MKIVGKIFSLYTYTISSILADEYVHMDLDLRNPYLGALKCNYVGFSYFYMLFKLRVSVMIIKRQKL